MRSVPEFHKEKSWIIYIYIYDIRNLHIHNILGLFYNGSAAWHYTAALAKHVKQIPEYIMQAARGNMTTEKKDSNVASKILLKNGQPQPADTIKKKNGWKTGTPLGKRGEGITAPIEATPQRDLRKIQGGITKTITDYNNWTQKIKLNFIIIPHKADMMYVDVTETEEAKEENEKKKGTRNSAISG